MAAAADDQGFPVLVSAEEAPARLVLQHSCIGGDERKNGLESTHT